MPVTQPFPGFDVEIIAGNGSAPAPSFAGAGQVRVCKTGAMQPRVRMSIAATSKSTASPFTSMGKVELALMGRPTLPVG